jgi:hydrogenase maturation protease
MIGRGRGNIVLIGVGNELRNDDGLGPLVVREIRRRSPARITIKEESGEGTSLMQAWSGASGVLLVDAVLSGEPPGFVHRLDAARNAVPRHFFHYSSHAFGVAEAIEMARTLHELPPIALLYGIEGEVFEPGVGLSNIVLRSVPVLISMIESDLLALRANEKLGRQFSDRHYDSLNRLK